MDYSIELKKKYRWEIIKFWMASLISYHEVFEFIKILVPVKKPKHFLFRDHKINTLDFRGSWVQNPTAGWSNLWGVQGLFFGHNPHENCCESIYKVQKTSNKLNIIKAALQSKDQFLMELQHLPIIMLLRLDL